MRGLCPVLPGPPQAPRASRCTPTTWEAMKSHARSKCPAPPGAYDARVPSTKAPPEVDAFLFLDDVTRRRAPKAHVAAMTSQHQ